MDLMKDLTDTFARSATTLGQRHSTLVAVAFQVLLDHRRPSLGDSIAPKIYATNNCVSILS